MADLGECRPRPVLTMAHSLPDPDVGTPVLRTSIIDCIDDADGSIDMDKFLSHTEELISQRKWATAAVSDLLNIDDAEECDPRPAPDRPREVKKRSPRRVWARKASEDGPLELISPQELSWYVMYVSNVLIMEDGRMMDKFRTRFCLPYPSYSELVEAVRSHPIFHRWCGKKKWQEEFSRAVARSWRFALLGAWMDVR